MQVTCPVHSDGQEQKPSCGITLIDRENVKAGHVHCFACGYSSRFDAFIGHCLGDTTHEQWLTGLNWIKKNYLTNAKGSRKRVLFPWDNLQAGDKVFVSEAILESFRTYHPYMEARKLTKEIITKYDVGYDKETDSLTFPVRDKNGDCLFISRRAVSEKRFHHDAGSHKSLYGIFEIDKNAEYVLICESIINCLTAVSYGYNAIALLGVGSAEQIEMLKKLPYRTIILALDGDKAGTQAAHKIGNVLTAHKLVGKIDFPADRDLNDHTKEEFDELFKNFSYLTLAGLTNR